MSISITGLTEEQIEMLDVMWALDSMEEYFEWYNQLSYRDQLQAETLQRLIILETIDSSFENAKVYPDAKRLLSKYQLK